jgi:phosphopantothenoylcysteine decarboxylase/phosphopantothenate--cysteine ligase
MHPSQDIKGIKTQFLKNKTIILAVTGSIAAVETIKLAREFIRHGADVIPVMTPAATKIIHPDALWFATGQKPIVDLTGKTEHVYYSGEVTDNADLLLISPCTANTLSKIAYGIDDTSVTTFATTAIGAKQPVIIVPAMHKSMYDHPLIKKNISTLKKHHINFVDPYLEQKKAKMASIGEICALVIRELSSKSLDQKNILIIGGSCCEPIDAVRSICNQSSGKTAISLATYGYFQGANIKLWYGKSPEIVPSFISIERFQTIDEVKSLINKTDVRKFDMIFVCAALSDYIPKKIHGKLSSDKDVITLSMKKTEKLIKIIREKTEKSILIGFKLDTDQKTVIKKAKQLQKDYHLDYVLANTTSSINSDKTQSWLIKNTTIIPIKGSKDQLAHEVFSQIRNL